MKTTTWSLNALALGACLLWIGPLGTGESTTAAAKRAAHPAAQPTTGPTPRESAERAAFIMTVGADTLGVETFSRTPQTLTGEIVGRQIGRFHYTASLTPEALVSRWEMSAWLPNAAASAPPMQVADIVFRGDSVIATLTAGGATQTQRFQTEPGALPTYPTSIALLEQTVRRAHVIGGDHVEIPLFALAGGTTIRAAVARLGPDSVTIAVGGAQVRLRVDDEGRVLGGTIPAQNLTITRVAQGVGAAAAERAGEMPPPDYSAPPGAPYTAEEVTIQVPAVSTTGATGTPVAIPGAGATPLAAAAHTLAGTLTLPKNRTGPVPAVVTISGSGPQRRDADVLPGYEPFREIADALGRRGIAVLRLDDRGTGASTGDFAAATSADFAYDVSTALAYLQTRPEIDASRLVLLGHSEGGLIAPMVAASDTSVAAIVLMAAPAETGREIIDYQLRNPIDAGTMLKTAAARDSAFARAKAAFDAQAAASPWLRFFLDYDPLPTAAKVRQPVLILQGATDRQVTAGQAEELAAAIRGNGNTHVEVHVFPDLDHLFLFDPDGSPSGYAALPSKQVAPVVLYTIGDWLVKTLF
jgi:pimeloyl-ACP methyl ester carboxylesterase